MDRHLAARGDQKALIYISTEVDREISYTYRELHAEVNRLAAIMLGIDRNTLRKKMQVLRIKG